MLLLPIALAAFTHMWNPIGQFSPWFGYDEGAYMGHTMHVLAGLGPHRYYDHPYFGQLFLASVLRMIGYPNSLHPSANDIHSIEMLLFVPRVVMGILAVFDTFLIYKISERRYNTLVGLIASVLFAVTPLSWFTRLVLLDSIQLPFILSSILFASYVKASENTSKSYNNFLSSLSGIFLGLSIFTKEPAFILILLVGFLIFKNSNRNLKILALWFVPVILLPSIWPAYSIYMNNFNEWLQFIHSRTNMQGSSSLYYAIKYDFNNLDSLLLISGMIGLVYSVFKRDLFLLMWVIPFIIFLYSVGFVQIFHPLPLVPAFCIAVAVLITDISNKLSTTSNSLIIGKKINLILPFTLTFVLVIYGLVNTTILITSDPTKLYFKSIALVGEYLVDNSNGTRIALISNPFFGWMFSYVFYPQNDYRIYDSSYDAAIPIHTEKVILIADQNFMSGVYSGANPFTHYYVQYATNATDKVIDRIQRIYSGANPFTHYYYVQYATNATDKVIDRIQTPPTIQIPKDWRSSVSTYIYDSSINMAYRVISYKIPQELEYDGVLLKPKTLTPFVL